MVVIVFRSRLRPGVEKEIEKTGARMYELATSMPGFISYREYASADGESVAIVEFESQETLAAWRNHPEHLQAQAAGRDRYFSEYRITVCESVRESSFPSGAAPGPGPSFENRSRS
jgi:heme-degrading monooxygenase HmoA